MNDDSDGSQKLSRVINSQMNFSSDSDEEKKKKKARKLARQAQKDEDQEMKDHQKIEVQ